MKRKNKRILLFTGFAFLLLPFLLLAQQDSVKEELHLQLAYFMQNNKMMYVTSATSIKVNKRFIPVEAVPVTVYLHTDSVQQLIGKLVTDKDGMGKLFLPPALKEQWNASGTHTFTATSSKTKAYDETSAELVITKSKLLIDTVADSETKKIAVTVLSLNQTEWIPVKDVEIKIGISRIAGSILSAGDEETYTTDSTGTVTTEFTKLHLPGDTLGNILLTAKVEEHEQLGNLLVEKSAPWGIASKPNDTFFKQRALWSTRFKAPYWLLLMAYSIVIGVWGTLIYLILQLIKIKKAGFRFNAHTDLQ